MTPFYALKEYQVVDRCIRILPGIMIPFPYPVGAIVPIGDYWRKYGFLYPPGIVAPFSRKSEGISWEFA